jgi:hypothetical protein
MIAYFIHEKRKGRDTIYLPDRGCFVAVDKAAMERFISVKPDLATWTGQACVQVKPEEFGTVVATRNDPGDVCVIDPNLWRKRMLVHLDSPL